jgi:hypothetical protein
VAIDHANQHDHAQIGVIPAVDQQCLERRLRIAAGRRQALDNGLEHGGHVLTGLGRNGNGVGGIKPDHLLDLLLDPIGIGRRQVDLVENGEDLEVVFQRLVDVGQGLRLHTLAGIHHQNRALAGRKAARDLVGKVDVARRVHQVELVGLAILGRIVEANGLRLDGDAALALDIHGIEDLLLHLAQRDVAAQLDQPIREGRLAVIDMGDDREIAD